MSGMVYPDKLDLYTVQQRFEFIKGGEYYVAKELMQYTGLHDKNGKEIYEGDILKITYKLSGKTIISSVRWANAKFKPTRLSEHNQYEIEIIGNIYQNPELLKV